MKFILIMSLIFACSGKSLTDEEIREILITGPKEVNESIVEKPMELKYTEAFYMEDENKLIPEDYDGLFTEWRRSKIMNFGSYQISNFSEHRSNRYRYNRYGKKLYDEQVLRPNSKYEYVSIDYTITLTSDDMDPNIPAMVGYWIYPDRTISFAGIFKTEHYRWTNEATYRGKYDPKNDFRKNKSIKFTSALMVEKDSQAALEVGFVGSPCVYKRERFRKHPIWNTSACKRPIRRIKPIDVPQNITTVYVYHPERLGRKIRGQGKEKPIK